MLRELLLTALLGAGATANYSGNLNYRSPSTLHPSLGIDVDKVAKRQLSKRDNTDWDPARLNYTHGVASGDPYANSVILWTRIAPTVESDTSNITVEGNVPFYSHETEQYIRTSSNPICVDWKVSLDAGLVQVVTAGQAYTTSDIDYTLKVRLSIHDLTSGQ
jgi:alkaline phosphatase D